MREREREREEGMAYVPAVCCRERTQVSAAGSPEAATAAKGGEKHAQQSTRTVSKREQEGGDVAVICSGSSSREGGCSRTLNSTRSVLPSLPSGITRSETAHKSVRHSRATSKLCAISELRHGLGFLGF
jgi:hypothetical protein